MQQKDAKGQGSDVKRKWSVPRRETGRRQSEMKKTYNCQSYWELLRCDWQALKSDADVLIGEEEALNGDGEALTCDKKR